jgi:hypothetical protein
MGLGRVDSATAHGFGQRYDLPVPLWLYMTGAAAAVAFSFVIIGVCVRSTHGWRSYPRLNLLHSSVGRLLAHPLLIFCLRLVSVGLFILLILAGLLGNQDPTHNLAPTLVWVVWWVGLAYISALLGNLWALINPWDVLFTWAETLYRRVTAEGDLSYQTPYPPAWGVWPGVLLLLAFSWVELVFEGAAVPAKLAGLALVYSGITWSGMLLFGKDVWLRHGEVFSLVFGLFARFAPTEVRVLEREVCQTCRLACGDDAEACIDCYACFRRADATQREWNLRPYAVGLLRDTAHSVSQMAFVLLLLATVTFDGFMATPLWADIASSLYVLLPALGETRLTIIKTLGLVSFPCLFLEVYLITSILIAVVSGGRFSGIRLAQTFVFTLVPIALAYHLAHYLSFLLVQGQLMIPLASDPFGWGWNLLGTKEYRVNIAVVDARFGWYTAVIAIVLGHIVAVYLAHLTALRTWHNRVLALRSQYPMLVLMVGFTVVSLWILAQPIVEGSVDRSASTAVWQARHQQARQDLDWELEAQFLTDTRHPSDVRRVSVRRCASSSNG